MIYNFNYGSHSDRSEILNFLKEKKYGRVIDVGASANGWSVNYLTHYLDIVAWKNSDKIGFLGNICSSLTWDVVLSDVEKNGKFDFAICSHTLEDISSPLLVNEMLCRIAKGGFIAVPSKNMELSRNVNGRYYGYVHHRWIYNKEGKKFVAYPKLSFIEYLDWSSIKLEGISELHFYWQDDFAIDFVNDDYMGPDVDSVYRYFQGLLN